MWCGLPREADEETDVSIVQIKCETKAHKCKEERQADTRVRIDNSNEGGCGCVVVVLCCVVLCEEW